jgi:hypothetical protein
MNTTPKAITPRILELCKKLDDTQTPVFVPVKPAAGAVVNECYPNVEAHIKKNGGSIRYGWIIWEHPDVIIEGNFHACWVDASNQIIDITPKQDREQTILFLPDSKRIYDGTPIDNVREIITTDPKLIASFKRQEELSKLRIKYNVNGNMATIPVEELKKIGMAVPDGAYLDMTGRTPSRKIVSKVRRNDRCPCGSGDKYKKCCGR